MNRPVIIIMIITEGEHLKRCWTRGALNKAWSKVKVKINRLDELSICLISPFEESEGVELC